MSVSRTHICVIVASPVNTVAIRSRDGVDGKGVHVFLHHYEVPKLNFPVQSMTTLLELCRGMTWITSWIFIFSTFPCLLIAMCIPYYLKTASFSSDQLIHNPSYCSASSALVGLLDGLLQSGVSAAPRKKIGKH